MRTSHALRVAACCALIWSLGAASATRADETASEPALLDVVFALDSSTSALAASGADIDGDGRAAIQRYFLGFIPTGPKRSDSMLAAG